MPEEDAARYVRVLVDRTVDRAFDYQVPSGLTVHVGSRVRVPFRNRVLLGTVVSLPERPEVERPKLLEAVVGGKPVVPRSLLELACWMAEYYCCTLEAAMRAVLPEVIRKAEVGFREQQFAKLAKRLGGEDMEALRRRSPKQAKLVDVLAGAGRALPVAEALRLADTSRASIRSLERKGVVEVESDRVSRDPYRNEEFLPSPKLALRPEQEAVMGRVRQALRDPAGAKPLLLHGVTGSGKTEIYLQALEQVLDAGGEAIVLVPEISLTPQTVERFKSRFAEMQSRIAVLHSMLSAGERHDEWHKIHSGSARIVIGPRSAIFAPLGNLGMIIVDEEHENSYKQEEAPRYHARDLAVLRGRREGCVVLLGSATPSHESYHNALRGRYELVELPTRVDDRRMPDFRLVDMRLQSRGGRDAILSERLRQAMEARLERGEQTILFLNRRGFSTSIVCKLCGHVCQCRNCSLPLTFHRAADSLVCHVCGHREKPPRCCPECADPGIRHAGVGTEKVEAAVRKAFPKARIARMDADTMTRRHAYAETLGAFKARKTDILVGTQMIAKGLHFPNVTLVGIVMADMGMVLPDFRASERTFQLLTQVAGRAGRGEVSGEVIVQSYIPHHPAIQFARQHDYLEFHRQDAEIREKFGFPPYTHMILLTVRGAHEGRAKLTAETLGRRLAEGAPEGAEVGDAAPAPMARLKGLYRFHVTLRSPRVRPLARHLGSVLAGFQHPDDVAIAVDVDPLNLL